MLTKKRRRGFMESSFAFSTSALPAYHPGLLLVRMRPAEEVPFVPAGVMSGWIPMAVAPGAPLRTESAAVLGAVPPPEAAQTQGLAALSYFERAGMVKRVTPLARPAAGLELEVGQGLARELAMAAAMASEPRLAATALLATSVPGASSTGTGNLGGVSIVELEREEDGTQLRLALAADPHVASVSRVPVRYLAARRAAKAATGAAGPVGAGIAAIPPVGPELWNLNKIRWSQARQQAAFKEADSIKVAVLDTGVDENHPDLSGRISGYVHAHPDLPGASSPRDIVGHGTHVSGTIAANINNMLGINGLCNCKLYVWKIFSDVPTYVAGLGWLYLVNPVMYLRALDDCHRLGMDVINLSIGGRGQPSAEEQEAFDALLGRNSIVVAAMGNERQSGSPTSYPAAVSGVIAVGATGLDDRVALFSNAGSHICVSAPGTAIWSTLPGLPGQTGFQAVIGPDGKPKQGKPVRREINYDAWNGTSMATPHVTGSVALLLAKHGPMTPAQVRQALAQSVDKVLDMGGNTWHPDFGFGRLNLDALLR
ncbi:S8 family serine peptidase [Roseomonas sp. NAR14]|uniref:S8 family serine peptidase n=1 Tax=Roseomonas acroporae TaxID=2937791 RepID=A0A9X1YAL4_9PROT|nr:S8 family serine peptidase [Roseomonas acroporae]MCK8786175.1 S8 family serine peptidase [Roseomonas acroporae]